MMAVCKPTLLTIDDDASIRYSLAAYFEDTGFNVIQACNGREGLELVRSGRPDIVLTDLRMPELDGLEVIEAISRMDDNLPVIMLSGTGALTDAIEALRRGAWDYIAKPVQDMEELELIVDRCMERARLVQENRACHGNLELLVNQRTAELRKLTIAVEQSANSVVITDVEGLIEYVNPKFTQLTGYLPAEVIGRNPRILNSGRQPDSYYAELWKTISAGREWQGEFCNKAKDEREYWELCNIAPIKDEAGCITHFVAIKEDISERKKYEEKLYYQAHFDGLTGLPNRYYFKDHLEKQLAVVDPRSQHLALMVLDIDNLKSVNDTFGHGFGDQLLKEIAHRLEAVCGHDCVVSRFVGDEFVVIPPLTTAPADVVALAEKIRSAMNGSFVIKGTDVITTTSIGVVMYPGDGDCVESLLKNGEAAMYQAKKDGKNTVCLYTRELNHQLEQRFVMETRLHRALERGEFSLQYQPQINQAKGAIVGVEALLRWTPTGEAPVSPAQFIPILEESGLIVAVGEWVLMQACSQAVQWRAQDLPPLRMSVNISALQFRRSNLDVTVRHVLAATGLDPRCLCLELTESMIMIDSARTMEKLMSLAETGITFSLDDFGTGYSSLEYLGRLPINELKIDMSFIRRMLTTRNDAAVVNTIIAMGQGLDMELVAEGVETEEQLNYLAERECSVIQGYYYSRPLSPDLVARFVREWKAPLGGPLWLSPSEDLLCAGCSSTG